VINEDEKAAYRHRGVVSGRHDRRDRDLIGVREELVGRKPVWNHERATSRSNQRFDDDKFEHEFEHDKFEHDEFEHDEFNYDEFDLDDDHRTGSDVVVASGAGRLFPNSPAG